MNVRYVGGGHFIGIPARDLSEAEWKALSKKAQDALLASGHYEIEEANEAESIETQVLEPVKPQPKKRGK